MNGELLDRSVTTLVAETEYRLGASSPDSMFITDSETKYAVRRIAERDECFEVEIVQRGSSEGLDLRTRERTVLQHYVVHQIGHIWRNNHGMGLLPTTEVPRGRSSELEVILEESGRYAIREVNTDRIVAHEMRSVIARGLAVSLPFAVDEVIVSYRDPQGVPVYRSARWWRRT